MVSQVCEYTETSKTFRFMLYTGELYGMGITGP